MRTALVIGGGVAGPVAAMALRQAGLDAVVYEARPRPAPDLGAFLTVQVNGLQALRAVGADGLVGGMGFSTPAMHFRSSTGKLLGEVSTGESLADGTVGRTIRRSDLYHALWEEARRRGVRVEHGRQFVDARPTADGVCAVFADGSTVEGDLLIGADGIRSRVRQVIDPDAAPARYVPVLSVGGCASPLELDATPGHYEMIYGKRAFFLYAVAPDGTVWWGANPPRRDEPAPGELAAMSSAQWRDWLMRLFAPDLTPARAIIAATPDPIAGWATYDLPSVRRWHRDRMIVIGDAAHATAPSSGQGVSMAIEDAVELGRCLRDLPAPSAAFAAYEGLRRRRVERVVAQGACHSNAKAVGPFARVLRDLMLPRALRRAASPAGRGSLAWLHRHEIDWAAPVRDAPPARTVPAAGY